MKKFTFLVLLPFLMATTCYNDDCDHQVDINVLNNNLITIETRQTYHIGDTIWINASVNKIQTNVYTNQPINLFDSAYQLVYNLNFFRENAYSDPFPIYLTPEILVPDTGQFSNYGSALVLVKDGDNYVNRTGVKLLEAGKFKFLTYGIYPNEQHNCENIGINSNISNANNGNYFDFTVE